LRHDPVEAEEFMSVSGVRHLLLGAALLAVAAGPVHGQERQRVEKDANEIYNTVMSPFCPGRLLANCPSAEAADLRNSVKEQLAAGATKDQVLEELYAVWGEEVLGAPRGPVAWMVPIGVLVLGALLLIVWLGRTSRRMQMTQPERSGLDSVAEQRLQAELFEL
jgi:cytochrome c-type biogenesis protein CcmH